MQKQQSASVCLTLQEVWWASATTTSLTGRNRPRLLLSSFIDTHALTCPSSHQMLKMPVMYCVSEKPLQYLYGFRLKWICFLSKTFPVIVSSESWWSRWRSGPLSPISGSTLCNSGWGISWADLPLRALFLNKETSAKTAEVTCPSLRHNHRLNLFIGHLPHQWSTS